MSCKHTEWQRTSSYIVLKNTSVVAPTTVGVFRTPFCLLTQTQTHTLSSLVINHSASPPCNAQLQGPFTCTYCTSEHSDIWKCEKSLTMTPLSWVLVIFLPLCSYVWRHSIGSRSHWNMLLHSERVNLYVTASRVGSSFDGEPLLICLWLQRGLRHASCPCSALINGSGEREEGGKSVCVRPRQRLWGF